jgi:hypothetical protein
VPWPLTLRKELKVRVFAPARCLENAYNISPSVRFITDGTESSLKKKKDQTFAHQTIVSGKQDSSLCSNHLDD